MKYMLRVHRSIKGSPVSPQHSTEQDCCLRFSLPDKCQSHCFSKPACQTKNLILLAASVTAGPLSSSVIHSHLSSFQECASVILLYFCSLSRPLFSGPWCFRRSVGAVCGLVVPDLFILSGEIRYIDLLCVRWSHLPAPVW